MRAYSKYNNNKHLWHLSEISVLWWSTVKGPGTNTTTTNSSYWSLSLINCMSLCNCEAHILSFHSITNTKTIHKCSIQNVDADCQEMFCWHFSSVKNTRSYPQLSPIATNYRCGFSNKLCFISPFSCQIN